MATRRFIAFSAEFPNDNSELHQGTIWMCVDLCGPAEAHYPEVIEDELALEPIEIVESIELEGPIEMVPAPVELIAAALAPAPVPVEFLVADLAPMPVASDGSDFFPPETMVDEPGRIAPLVSTPPPALDSPFDAFLQTLSEVACDSGKTFAASEIGAMLAGDPVATAWRGILCGESEDFSLCATPLDEWAAGALARILDAPHKAGQLRRELRARGVAAFGLVAVAA
jgi:hypothetical protein